MRCPVAVIAFAVCAGLLAVPIAANSDPLWPTALMPIPATPTDRGGTMTTGGTAQTLAAANAARKAIVVENPCTAAGQGIATAEDLFLSVTGNATVAGAGDAADLAPCSSTSITVEGQVFTGAVSVNAATTGHRWSATEWQ